ncbi:MAG: MmgE/PrpD family protein, partial [Desulfobacterales bacterium]
MQATDHAIRFIREQNWQDFSQELQCQAKRCLLDALGAPIAGTETPAAKIVAGIAESQFGGSQASILVRGSKTSASGAA